MDGDTGVSETRVKKDVVERREGAAPAGHCSDSSASSRQRKGHHLLDVHFVGVGASMGGRNSPSGGFELAVTVGPRSGRFGAHCRHW